MVYCAAVDAVVNPAVAPGLEALRWHLLDNHYSDVATFDICHHVLEEGTLAGAPLLEPEDEAAAEQAFVDALPAVPTDDPAWGITEEDALFEAMCDAYDLEEAVFAAAGIGALPPICGGAPDYTDDDYADWLDSLDADYPPEDQAEPRNSWERQTEEYLRAREAGESWACI